MIENFPPQGHGLRVSTCEAQEEVQRLIRAEWLVSQQGCGQRKVSCRSVRSCQTYMHLKPLSRKGLTIAQEHKASF